MQTKYEQIRTKYKLNANKIQAYTNEIHTDYKQNTHKIQTKYKLNTNGIQIKYKQIQTKYNKIQIKCKQYANEIST